MVDVMVCYHVCLMSWLVGLWNGRFGWKFGLYPDVPLGYNHKDEPQIYAQLWVQLVLFVVGPPPL